MIVFLDTEFTDLVLGTRLLSIGIVAGDATWQEFYAEVTDHDRLQGASPFARNVVLPQFGKVAGAACRYIELCHRVCALMAGLAGSMAYGETIEMAFESDFDGMLVERVFDAAGASSARPFRSLMRPVNVHDIAGFGAGQRAAEAYFESQRLAAFSRHHALCDARALRIAYEAHRVDTAANSAGYRRGTSSRGPSPSLSSGSPARSEGA